MQNTNMEKNGNDIVDAKKTWKRVMRVNQGSMTGLAHKSSTLHQLHNSFSTMSRLWLRINQTSQQIESLRLHQPRLWTSDVRARFMSNRRCLLFCLLDVFGSILFSKKFAVWFGLSTQASFDLTTEKNRTTAFCSFSSLPLKCSHGLSGRRWQLMLALVRRRQ